MDIKKLIAEKKQVRSIRPRFRRSNSEHTLRVSRTGYRRPKGLHNKMKDQRKGHAQVIKSGFGYPKATRGLDGSGRKIVNITTQADLAQYKPADVAVIIDGTLGMKKRLVLLKELAAKKYHVHNVYKLDEHIVKLEKGRAIAAHQKSERATQRAANRENLLKAKKGQTVNDKKADTKSAEEKKADQKTEQDKVLIGK